MIWLVRLQKLSEDRIVAFTAAAGETQLLVFHSQQRGQLSTGLFQAIPGSTSGSMWAGGIAVAGGLNGLHCFPHFG